jgi:hypothetical protein
MTKVKERRRAMEENDGTRSRILFLRRSVWYASSLRRHFSSRPHSFSLYGLQRHECHFAWFYHHQNKKVMCRYGHRQSYRSALRCRKFLSSILTIMRCQHKIRQWRSTVTSFQLKTSSRVVQGNKTKTRDSTLWYAICQHVFKRDSAIFSFSFRQDTYRLTLDTCAFQEECGWPTLPQDIQVWMQRTMSR